MLAIAGHNTHRIGNVNTLRIATACIGLPMSTEKAKRLKAARERASFDSAADAARTFGWTESAYRHHENGTRDFGADAARKYGRAFKVKPGWLLLLENVNDAPPVEGTAEDRLIVNGSVEAGAWRATEEWNDERSYVLENMPCPIPTARRFGLELVGFSMDEFYEPGTALDCVSIFKGGVAPQNGDHVVVERVRPDGLRELTVKEYQQDGGRFLLVPRSSKPEFKPIEYLGPDVSQDPNGEQVHVIGFVIASYPPRTLALMRRMGVIKPMIRL